MTQRLAFSIPGEPKGKGRPRAVPELRAGPNGPEPFVRMVTPADTRAEESRVRAAFRARYPDHRAWTGPVLLRFTAVFETPRSFSKKLREAAARGVLYAIKKPDKDNIEKLVVDALNKVAFADDQQVMGGGIKRYGSPARIDVELELLTSPDVPATPGERRAERSQQPRLPLRADRGPQSNTTKSLSDGPRIAPDLSGYGSKARTLIERAMARDEAAKRARDK